MDDPIELVFVPSVEEIEKIERTDLCVTLYTLWDKLQLRGSLGERKLYTCRNDSPVPDESFSLHAKGILVSSKVLVDRGEAMVLSDLEEGELRVDLACKLQAALESL